MLQSIVDDVREQFRLGNMVTRIIIVNAAFFILINLVNLFFTLTTGFEPGSQFQKIIKYVFLHQDLVFDLKHPWVIISYMFVHIGLFHILWNMLLLCWFGRIVGDFIGDHRILPIYLMAGIMGGLVYLITAPLIYPGGGSTVHGASGAVMGIIVVAGMIAPDYIMRLLFIGDVKLKYIVMTLVFIDLLAIANMSNVGGHFAHIGGMLFGIFYIKLLKEGNDLAIPVNRLIEWFRSLFRENPGKHAPKPGKKQRKVFVRYRNEKGGSAPRDHEPEDFQDRIDAILDKIKANGYDSLTDEEKEFLFRASKK